MQKRSKSQTSHQLARVLTWPHFKHLPSTGPACSPLHTPSSNIPLFYEVHTQMQRGLHPNGSPSISPYARIRGPFRATTAGSSVERMLSLARAVLGKLEA